MGKATIKMCAKFVFVVGILHWGRSRAEDGTGAGLERNEAPQNKVNYIYVYFA